MTTHPVLAVAAAVRACGGSVIEITESRVSGTRVRVWVPTITDVADVTLRGVEVGLRVRHPGPNYVALGDAKGDGHQLVIAIPRHLVASLPRGLAPGGRHELG